MLPALLATLAWMPALVGLGSLWRFPGDPESRPGLAGLFGLTVAGTTAIGLNFIAAITPTVSLGIWLVGIASCAWRRRWIASSVRPLDLVAVVAVVGTAAYLMRQPLFQYDTGFYHLQAVQWTAEHPLVPGIANVHARLGFNSLWWPLAAAVEFFPAEGRSAFFLNLLPLAFCAQIAVVGVRRVAAGDLRMGTGLRAGLSLPVAGATFGIGGLYVDYTLAMIVVLSLAMWVAALDAEDPEAKDVMPAWVLSLLATTIKLSAAALPVLSLVLFGLMGRWPSKRTLLRMGGVTALIVGPFLARGLVQSGCLAFPATASCATALPWVVPEAVARDHAERIAAFARLPGVLAPGQAWTSWIPGWAPRVAREYPELRIMGLALLVGLVLWAVLSRAVPRGAVFVVGVSAGCLVPWIVSAPEPRFALGFLWALGLTPLLVAVGASPPARRRLVGRMLAVALVGCAASLAVLLDGQDRHGTVYRLGPWRPPMLGWPSMPPAPVREVTTPAGAKVSIPIRGACCWEAAAPCTPPDELDPGLTFHGYYSIRK